MCITLPPATVDITDVSYYRMTPLGLETRADG
jgi:hypothetical protein